MLNLADELGNISGFRVCKTMGVPKDPFHRYRDAVDEGGAEALLDQNRRDPNLKNREDPEVGQAVLEYAVEDPAHGQVRISNELRKKGVFVSPNGVRSIWLCHDLANVKQRLKALEKKSPERALSSRNHRSGLRSERSWTMKPVVKLKQLTRLTLMNGKEIWKEKFVA